MPLMRANLIVATIGCALRSSTAGCIAPWPAPAHERWLKKRSLNTATPSHAAASPTHRPSPGSVQPDMAGVLDKIQQVRAMDPAAEPETSR